MRLLHHTLEVARDRNSRAHARVHMEEEIELIMGKAFLAVFCLAAFKSQEEGLEIPSLCYGFGQSSYFFHLTIESFQQFAPPESLRYLCRCEALRPGRQSGASWEGAGKTPGLVVFVSAQERSIH